MYIRTLLRFLFSRLFVVGFLITLQVGVLAFILWRMSYAEVYLYALFSFISLTVVLWIVNKKNDEPFKLIWVILILIFPVFGGLLYLLVDINHIPVRSKRKLKKGYELAKKLMVQDEIVAGELKKVNQAVYPQSKYLYEFGTYPVYWQTETKFLSPGEIMFAELVAELEKAEHFIFMEYFIIRPGYMWDTVLDILERKAKAGLDVRVMFDDLGCITNLPYKYAETLKAKGIKYRVFNPIRPTINLILNNRDHRKITVIDGYVGFTGGINLADEYINHDGRPIYWKDSSILIKGDAVWNLTVMFLQVWNYIHQQDLDFMAFHPQKFLKTPAASDGFVQPFGDSPLDDENVSELAYIKILNTAQNYVYISSPYLIIDQLMFSALSLAAKSGIDVRIITPHFGDKWFVHTVTRSYYQRLIEAGVKIYEYLPGFIHSKVIMADDQVGIVGSINLDYRSLYSQFESGVWMYKSQALTEVKSDFLDCLEQSRLVTLEECLNISWYLKLIRALLRLIAPLM
ncbi:MAG: cardiolipin synthase [Methylocystaceae bacterium]